MFNSLFNFLKTEFFLIIVISIFLFIYGQGYAQVFVPNELNIKISQDIVKEGNAGDYISSLSRELEEDLKYFDENLEVFIIKIFLEDDPESQLTLWYKIKFVSEANLDLDDIKRKLSENYEHIVSVEKEFITASKAVPNDPVISKLTYDYYALIGAYEAWDMEQGSEDVIVAIIDSGIDVNHSDLVNRFVNSSLFKRYPPDSSIDPSNPTEECKLYPGKIYCFDIYVDSAELDNGVLPPEYDVRDVIHHGTPIAGIIAANHDNIGVPGICPNCKLLPIKVNYLQHVEEQSGQLEPQTRRSSTTGTLSLAIEYAVKNGADVINLSLSSSKKSDILEDAVNEAYKKYNCILIAAADNEDEESKSYPAAYNNVIGTTAIKVNTSNKIVRRDKAQYGTWIDVVAPGEKIVSLVSNSNNLKAYSGTSFTVPFVSGLAALVRSRDSNFTIHNLRQLIRESSTRIDDTLYDKKKLGYGLINLKRALDKLDDRPWNYSITTQQGYTSTGNSGGGTSSPYNLFFVNPYATGFSFNPFGAFAGFGLPMYGGSPSPFTPYFQQPLFPGSFGLPEGQFTQRFQQPYISSGFGYPLQGRQGFAQPFGSLGLPGQFSQQGVYNPLSVFAFSQSTPGFQQLSPFGGFGIMSPYIGRFGSSPFGVFGFPAFR